MTVDEVDGMSLQPLETPVLKVSRPVAACSRCRNAKIKCDGKLPACSSCEKNGRAAECTSTNDQFARGRERSYVSTLETRIDRLQIKLEEAHARKPSVVSIPDDETAVPSRRESLQQSPLEPISPTTSRIQKRKEVTAIDDLVSDFGFLSVNATARDFYGFTTAMSYARLILSACTKDELPQGTTKALPQRYIGTGLVQHYLNNVFVLLPVLDEASFYASVDNVYSKDPRKADAVDHWMVRMVLAIACASLSDSRGDQHYLEGIGHVCAALEHSESVLRPGNTSSVQALVLLTQYAMLDPHHFDSWTLIGAASRAMTDLGLHQDPPKGTAMQKGRLELRRRVYHCVYALDRTISLVQSRAFSFSDDSAKVKVPFSKQSNSAPTSPQPGAAPQSKLWLQSYEQALDLINLRKLQSAWYTDIFQSGRTRWSDPYTQLWDICDGLRKWFENLSASTTENMRSFFELDLLYSYIYVLSKSPRVPTVAPFAQKLIFEYCCRYADLMMHMITDQSWAAPLTFYDAMRVYLTGRQFLDVLNSNTDLLLNGFVPPHPEVKPIAAPPPPMPVVPPPPGETVQRFNTVRSINCIKQLTECLARFGLRWGYMSWNQRLQNETADMLEQLNQRLRELDEISGFRRQSMWQHSSVGSNPSSNGSISYSSPSQRMAQVSQGSVGYQQGPPSLHQTPSYGEGISQHQTPSYGDGMSQHQISPPQYHQQPNMYPQQPYNAVPPNMAYQQTQQPFQQQHQSFNFNDQNYNHASFPQNPNQQFASWHGYGGPSHPDTLDDENANPHRASVSVDPLAQQAPQRTSNARQSSPRPRAARLGPNLRPVAAPPSTNELARISTQAAGQQNRPSLHRSAMSRASVMPLFTDNWKTGDEWDDGARRTSMQDAALDILESTYPATRQPSSAQPGSAVGPSNRRWKGKAKATGRGASNIDPEDPTKPRLMHKKGSGYICMLCNMLCYKPELHHIGEDQNGCVDFGSDVVPWVANPKGGTERDPTTIPPELNEIQEEISSPALEIERTGQQPKRHLSTLEELGAPLAAQDSLQIEREIREGAVEHVHEWWQKVFSLSSSGLFW